MTIKEDYEQYVESKIDVQTYLDRLKFAFKQKSTTILFQEKRQVDGSRDPKYTNGYAIAQLFPNDDKTEVMKRELEKLDIKEYIETVKDLNFPERSDMRVFGRTYNTDEVYIKFRVEILPGTSVFVMSFHFSTLKFKTLVFPYK